MDRHIEVGVLGATGMVGQQFINQLAGHPWFRVRWLGASRRSEGKPYRDAAPWRLAGDIPADVADLSVELAEPGRAPHLVFSALDASVAGEIEQAFAAAGHIVVSNARNHRMERLVPLLVPEVNADHLSLLPAQRRARGGPGGIVTNPNCSTVVLTMVLAPLRQFGLRSVIVTTAQAISGAGYPGVPSIDITANIIPFIAGEEEKIETETRKILGRVREDGVEDHPATVSAQTTRVPVVNGHTEMVAVGFDAPVPLEELRAAWTGFSGQPQALGLPTAPSQPVVYRDEPNRPQPRLDAGRDGGMTVTVGRLRACPVLHAKFVALGHNTVRGAAGAAVLNAELMLAQGGLD